MAQLCTFFLLKDAEITICAMFTFCLGVGVDTFYWLVTDPVYTVQTKKKKKLSLNPGASALGRTL
jgi:choline-glycine betaine transporter